MNGMDDILNALFGTAARNGADDEHGIGSAAWMRGFEQPKHEHRCADLSARVRSRIACNNFILQRLRGKS